MKISLLHLLVTFERIDHFLLQISEINRDSALNTCIKQLRREIKLTTKALKEQNREDSSSIM